jgi:hypothetical protein
VLPQARATVKGRVLPRRRVRWVVSWVRRATVKIVRKMALVGREGW